MTATELPRFPPICMPPTVITTTPSQSAPPRKPKRSAWRGIAFGLAGGIAVGACGLQVGRWLAQSSGAARGGGLQLDGGERLMLIIALLVAIHIVLLVHELGHLLGGRLVGFRAFLLIVGPVRLERGASGWQLHRNQHLALWGGLAGSSATDDRDLPSRTAVMIASGPIASLLAGLLGLWACWSLDPQQLSAASPFGSVLLVFTLLTIGVTSLGIMFATLIPIQTSGFLSDGARLLRLLRRGPDATRDTALQALIAQSLAGVRPRDWPRTLLDAALALDDGSTFAFTARQLAQMHAADSGSRDEAKTLLARLVADVESLPPALRSGFHLDAARQLATDGDLLSAEAQFAAADGPVLGGAFLRPLAEAAILVERGAGRDALVRLDEVRLGLRTGFDRGGTLWLSDEVDRLEARARQIAGGD